MTFLTYFISVHAIQVLFKNDLAAFWLQAITKDFGLGEKAGHTNLTFSLSLFYEQSEESFHLSFQKSICLPMQCSIEYYYRQYLKHNSFIN
jgi:hypothetical protein